MQHLEAIIEGLFREAEDDEVGLWRLVAAIRHNLGQTTEADIQATSLQVVEKLIERGVDLVDYHEGRGWAKWPEQSVEAKLARIQREWNALGRAPNLGDICWFTLRKNG